LQAARRDMAITLLGEGIPAAEVSLRMGFATPSAFGKAFRAWTGTTPGSYRSDFA
jgi:AraC-like DNA-binding protein